MHYKDGTEAKLGDLVTGTPYNTGHQVVGTVVGLVPGADSCNLRVAYIETTPARYSEDGGALIVPLGAKPRMALGGNELYAGAPPPLQPDEKSHVAAGHTTAYEACAYCAPRSNMEPPAALWPCVDYGATKDFTLIARGR